MKQNDLNGVWTMKTQDGQAFSCTVPGSVAACLLEHGEIDDPYVADNEKKVLPVFDKDYTFTRSFSAAPEDIAHDSVLLRCEGLDTIAAVSLNGALVGNADNMHRTWAFDAKPYLREGENEISVAFTSPVKYLEEHPSQTGKPFATIRKAACMFGWDWGINLPDSGIWRDIHIESFDLARIEHIQTRQSHGKGVVELDITIDTEFFRTESVKAMVELKGPDGEHIFSAEKEVEKGEKAGFICKIENPHLWWPVDYGEQPLYTLRTALVGGGRELDISEKKIGLRTLSLDRSKRSDGSNYGFVVNGKPIFFRGENLIIDDAIISRTTNERWETLVKNAMRSNLNGLRVWGGAYYPPDYFYELCDKHGLMVYQDFMFACTFYATPKAFVENVRHEVRDNLKRIAHHPCIALYCGNNELDCIYTVMTSDEPETAALRALFGAGDKLSWLVKNIARLMYKKLFLKLIPALCRELAPNTSYVHSSPSISRPGKAKSFFDYLSDGDMHYYLQYNDNAPYQKLREFHVRFMTEMGFQSYPSMKTIAAFAEKDAQSPYSDIMYAHQKCKDGNEAIEIYMDRDYVVPTDFSQYVYLSQLQAGEIMKYSIEHLRRDSGYCRGMVIWQMNDCWPVVSWSGIDYFGRWKAQQYYTKRFYSPVLVSADVFEGTASIWVTNDSPIHVSADLRWTLRASDGAVIHEGKCAVSSVSGSSDEIVRVEYEKLLPAEALCETYLEFELSNEDGGLGGGTAMFVLAKDFRFKKPALNIAVEESVSCFTVTVTSDCFAKGVALDTHTGDCLFSDNFFDVSPGLEKKITVLRADMTDIKDLDELELALTVSCLNEVMLTKG